MSKSCQLLDVVSKSYQLLDVTDQKVVTFGRDPTTAPIQNGVSNSPTPNVDGTNDPTCLVHRGACVCMSVRERSRV